MPRSRAQALQGDADLLPLRFRRYAGHACGPASSKGKPSNTDPSGAIAKCHDGTYSHAKGHPGACSNHGGVGEWLDKK
jgi:hypothetical protein